MPLGTKPEKMGKDREGPEIIEYKVERHFENIDEPCQTVQTADEIIRDAIEEARKRQKPVQTPSVETADQIVQEAIDQARKKEAKK